MATLSVSSFLQLYFDSPNILDRMKILCFQFHEYQPLFFAFLTKKIHYLSRLSVNDSDIGSLICALETTFLGQKHVYYLGDISQLDKKKKDSFLSYIYAYNGPHTIILFLNNKDSWKSKNGVVVSLENIASADLIKQLTLLLPNVNLQRVQSFMKQVLKITQALTIDQLIILFQYANVLGSQADDFIKTLLSKVVAQESSLFTLSQHFFARNIAQFYSSWANVIDDYPEIFWITFWSEQTFRAHYFLKMRLNQKIEAKKIAFRLPFSFIQRDWQSVTEKELQHAHQYIYDIDYSLKNGLSNANFDIFFAKFFARQF